MTETITFTGKVIKKIFHSPENSWGVAVISSETEIPFSKIHYDYDIDTNETKASYTISIVGKMPTPEIGYIFVISGHHIYSTKYKQDQIEIETVSMFVPKTKEDMDSYLKSILTENQAETLLATYPNIVQDIVDGKDNVDLSLLKGFGQITYDKAKEKIIENFAISDIITLLIPLGVSFNKLKKLLDDEPNPQILKERLVRNPYKLTDIRGISFATADKIAVRLNPSLMESEERLKAFIQYTLEKIGDGDGHAYVEKEVLKSEVIASIPECEKFLDSFIEKEKNENKLLHIEDDKIGLLYYYNSEKYIYEFLNRVHDSKPLEVSQENIEEGIRISEEKQGFPFSEEQKNILYEMVKSNLNILSGFGGSGKSSLSRGILNIYNQAGYSIGVCALSAKAAKRAQETTGYKGLTIHRLLESNSISFQRNEHLKLEEKIILVDETSMCNSYILMSLFKAISEGSKVILVGDHFQLPPIQFGQVFTDLLTTENKYQKNILTQPYRTDKNSAIFVDAMKMRMGENPLTEEEMKQRRTVHGKNSEMIYIFSDSKEYLHDMALKSYMKAVQEDGVEETVILTPRKKDVLNCTQQFNTELQEELNSENMDIKFEHGKKRFLLDDWVIQTANNKDMEIYNGYTGKVTEIRQNSVVSLFDDEIKAEHKREDIGDLELARSISCHRSQGSEYQSVIVVLDMNSFTLLFSELMYTARTRGKKRVMILAQPKAYKMCLNESKNKRKTWFKEMLLNGISS